MCLSGSPAFPTSHREGKAAGRLCPGERVLRYGTKPYGPAPHQPPPPPRRRLPHFPPSPTAATTSLLLKTPPLRPCFLGRLTTAFCTPRRQRRLRSTRPVMERAAAFLELVAKQVDPGAPGFWRDFLVGMLKPVAATAVVAMAVALSFSQRLGLEGEMLYAIARAFLQLSIIGFVLQFIFTQKNALWILLAYLFMVTVAGYTAGQRAKQVPRGKYIACVSILVGTAITMFLLVVLNVFPFTPRYIIPVAGMMVGNAMTVTGVTMKKLREDVKIQRNLVETALALGATPRQATLQQVKRSLVIALSPVIDNAKTVGLIALPGAMTGLIMGGASPLEAIQLQIVVMNMLMGASTVSSILSTYLCWPAFFTKAFQLEDKVFAD
uniref:Uncharacterized protein n=2 Tax=Setaria viridis TaxID=4556 RepID=A0A4U6V560_SETVI|nr:hypothetical protein SEVIR_3G044400v2 [Setaria viridis]